MNPLAWFLLALSLTGFLFRRRGLGVSWLVVGVAGMALLAPALALPDGIPSPSAILGGLAPWGEMGQDPAGTARVASRPAEPAGNPTLVDVTFQVEPLLLYLKQEVRSGRLPFWNPYQSSGAPFWSNGQSAPLFPLHLLFILLPERLGFLLLPWLRILVGGLGTWAFARRLGVGRQGCLLAAVIYPLSGRVASFLLFPMGNALCLVPWAFLAVERIAAAAQRWSRRDFALLGAIAGLQLLAGHPETPLMTALASAVYLAVRGVGPGGQQRFDLRRWLAVVGAWVVGAALAAVQLVPLAFTLFDSSRWHEPVSHAVASVPERAAAFVRFFLPNAFGTPMAGDLWGDYWGAFNFTSSTVYLGATCLPLALWGALSGDRRHRALGWTALFSFAAAFGLPGLRHLLYVLPILEKSLHHYLLLGLALPAAVLAGVGLERWRDRRAGVESPSRPLGLLVGAGLAVVVLAAAWIAFAERWREAGATAQQAGWTVWLLAVLGLLVAGWWLPDRLRIRLAPLLIAATVIELAVAHAPSNPGLSIAEHYPDVGVVEHLHRQIHRRGVGVEVEAGRVVGAGLSLRPNAGMVYGLPDVRGDDSLKLRWYEAMWARELGAGHPTFFRPIDRWQSPWLDRLSVRWVMSRPGAAPPVGGWTLAYSGPDAILFERPDPLPVVRFAAGTAGRLQVVEHLPNRWRISWQTAGPATVVVGETWARGWRATVDGTPVSVERVDDVMMGVRVPGGEGRLTLAYRPPGIGLGALVSLSGLLGLVGLVRWPGRLAHRRPSR